MSVYPAGFSERVFEFSFNAEYASANHAVLAAAPYIPTQNEERWLGYDVEFLLRRRGATTSLALQHKVCRFVDSWSGSNRHFWDAVGGPYFAFRLDVDQYNLIHAVSSSGLSGVEFYYCIPRFTSREDMDRRYMSHTVLSNSLWINVASASEITDSRAHTIVCGETGLDAFRFSEQPMKLKTRLAEDREVPDAQRHPITIEDVRKKYSRLHEIAADYWPRRRDRGRATNVERFRLPDRPPPQRAVRTTVEGIRALRELFSDYYGVTWLVDLRNYATDALIV